MLTRFVDDWNAYETAKGIDIIKAMDWITSTCKRSIQSSKSCILKKYSKFERSIKSFFAKCGVLEQPASIDDNEDVDEEFKNLFEELSEELQIDENIPADEYSNFDHEVCTSFPAINSDYVD